MRIDCVVDVPDGFVKSCAFLCLEQLGVDGTAVRVPKATGFFVRVRSVNPPGIPFDYFVTARHCLTEARATGGPLWIRVMTEQGLHEQPTEVDRWYEHDFADAAAILMLPGSLPSGLTQKDLRQSSLSPDAFVDDDYVWRGEPPGMGHMAIEMAVGEDICFTGLFSASYGGMTTNLPIARFGRISRMPSQIAFNSGSVDFSVTAYLVEATSSGGFSGSPVFFMHPVDLVDDTKSRAVYSTATISGVIGLVSGHFPAQHDDKSEQAMALNSGIAIVSPISVVRQLLYREDVVEQRDRLAKETIEGVSERLAQSPNDGAAES